jgi:hypothetical protein
MRRTVPILTIFVLILALALAAAACGSEEEAAAPAPSPTVSAEQLVQQSLEATSEVTSGSFTADLALKVQDDTSKMDPSAQAMIGQGLSVHAAGKSAESPVALDMTVSLGIAGQTLEFAVKAQDDEAWVQYQGKWYEVDQKTMKGMGVQASPSASPMDQLEALGLDAADLGATFQYAGAQDLNGTQVYRVTAAVDPQKMADALLEALSDPAVLKQLGQSPSGDELQKSLKENREDLQQFRDSLKSATAEFWIGVDDMLLRKATMAVALDMTGQTDAELQGMSAVNLAGSLTMGEFGEPVTVTPPADALPFEQLMQAVFGGMFGGMMDGGSGLEL